MIKTKIRGALIVSLFFIGFLSNAATAQTYDSSSLVDSNSTSTSTVNSTSTSTNTNINTVDSTSTSTNTNNNNNVNTSTSTSTNVNTNNNINSGEQTFNNNNVNTSTSTNTNTNTNTNVNTNNNINSGTQTFNNNNTSTSTNTNNNNNVNTTTSTNNNNNVNSGDQTVRNVQSGGTTNTNNNNNVNTSDNTNRNIQSGSLTNINKNDSTITQRVVQPPPTAIAPAMMSGGNNDLCTTGTSGALQTQILGISTGGTVRDMNCERLKLSKTLYDMGMKVAAVATMCQDRRVFDAMWTAGTPCPFDGKIGDVARELWDQHPERIPKYEKPQEDTTYKKLGFGAILGAIIFKLFGF